MIEIVIPTIRDASYIGASLREPDRRELECQLMPGSDIADAATLIIMGSAISHIVRRNGSPIAAFGLSPMTHVVWSLWAFGTKELWRAIPAISKHFWRNGDTLIAMGVRRLEVRAWKGHDLAPLWLAALGCTRCCELSDHGHSGEAFELWAWTATDYLDGSMKRRRGGERNVLWQNPETTQTAQGDRAAEPAGRIAGRR